MRQEKLRKLARDAPGLDEALSEMGPNHATEFADALEIEGYPKPKGGYFPVWESIGKFREALTGFLAGADHAFIGGIAVRSYGAREAPTTDYDVMIDGGHLQEITSFLEKQGAILKGTVEDSFRVDALKFDFDVRVARSPLDREALASARGATFGGRKLRIVQPDHLAAMKVKAYSERKGSVKGDLDSSDVRGLVAVEATTVDAVRDALRKHRPDLLPELDEIIAKA